MVRAFFKAVLIGTLAGAGLPLIFSALAFLFSLSDGGAPLLLLIFPLVLSFAFVLPSAILIGLPVTWLLKHLGRESPTTYATIGGIAGATVVAILHIVVFASGKTGDGDFNLLTILLGAFSGGVTGWTWGKERKRATEAPERYFD